MKVFIRGKGEVELTKADFIAQGGEGSVYAKGKTAFKIYNDPSNMIPLGKFQELSVLTHDNIIKPTDIICDSKNKTIGYTMTYVKDTYALCQLFTKAFRQRNNISPQNMFDLVKKLQDIVKHTHDHKILIVDLNEMNFLCDQSFKEIYAIDTDSYQTPSFHATALMDSIRDRHAKPNHFDQGTDWFAFAIVSFSMFIGIHPFKGKHPTLKIMDDRMLQNISVFHKDVGVPNVCYDFSVIPKNYVNWYKAVFDDGKRMSPPFEGQILQVIQKINTIVGNNKFDIRELFDALTDINHFVNLNGVDVCITSQNCFINKKATTTPFAGALAITPKQNKIVAASLVNSQIQLIEVVSGTQIPFISAADSLMEYDGRIYFKNYMNICEVIFTEIGTNIIASGKIVGQVMPNSSLYPGVIIQNLMDAYYASLFPKSGTCYQIKLDILKGYKIIEAKYDNRVLFVIAAKGGKYNKFIFRFDDTYSECDVRIINDINYTGLNFVVLDNGICVHITEDETIEIFSNKKDSSGIKVVDDPMIKGDMELRKNGSNVLFTKGSKVYSFKLK